MAEENGATETDIFMQQKKVIDTLVNELARQGQAQQQPVYVSQPVEQTQKPTNYILYIGIGVVLFLLLRK